MTPTRFRLLAALSATCVAASVYFVGSEKLLAGILAPSAAFSGMLALNGFMFAARTFITFKLNETVYSRDEYRKEVAKFQNSGDYKRDLYEPLKTLDSTVGRASLVCFGTLFALALYALLPKNWGDGAAAFDRLGDSPSNASYLRFWGYQLATWFIYSGVLVTILTVLTAILRVNANIRSIIEYWEADAKRKSDADQTS